MLKTRVIPTLLWKEVGLVKGVSFDSGRRIGTVLPAIKVFNTREVDELVLLDVTASLQGRAPDFESIREFAAACFVPFTVGGGITNVDDIRTLLRSGADKVSLCSAAFSKPELITQAAELFGSQCIVVSIDVRQTRPGYYEVFGYSGTRPMNIEAAAWAAEAEKRGAGEILLTSIDRDGTMQGYDLELIRSVSSKLSIPCVASGGAGNYEHLYRALRAGANAVAAASIFQFTEQTPLEAKRYLASHGIPVRDENRV